MALRQCCFDRAGLTLRRKSGFRGVGYAEDYERLFSELARQQEALGEEMRASERFQDAQRKLAYRGEAEP